MSIRKYLYLAPDQGRIKSGQRQYILEPNFRSWGINIANGRCDLNILMIIGKDLSRGQTGSFSEPCQQSFPVQNKAYAKLNMHWS